MHEEWRPVHGWEGLYEVSGTGQVRSLPRKTVRGVRGGKVMNWYVRGLDGYPEVRLYRDGTMLRRFVHHLVLEAFIRPRPHGYEAKHGAGGKLDCSVGNLEWRRQCPPGRWGQAAGGH
jgi:hypothetical protein